MKTMKKLAKPKFSTGLVAVLIALLILIIGVFIGFGLVQLSYIGPHEATITEFTPVNYTDYVTILLTAITVILTVLGLFIAIVAVFSFTFLRSLVSSQATTKTEEIMDGALSEGGTIHSLVIEKLRTDSDFKEQVILAVTSTFIDSVDEELIEEEDENE